MWRTRSLRPKCTHTVLGACNFFCFETVHVNEEKCQRLLQGKKNNYCFLNWAREYCEEEIGGGHSLYSLDCAQSSIFPCDCFERYSWARAVAILISRGKKLLRSVTFGWRVWISSTTPPPPPNPHPHHHPFRSSRAICNPPQVRSPNKMATRTLKLEDWTPLSHGK